MAGFRTGDLIYRSKPYAYVLNEESKGQICDYCFTKKDKLKKCTQCALFYYCGEDCQKNAWEEHKMECKHLKDLYPKKLTKSLILLLRILNKIKKFGVNQPVEDVWGLKVTFETLMSHSDKVDDDLVTTAYGIFKSFLPEKDVPSVSVIRVILGKMTTNNFNISNETESIGGGLYLGASKFDHSCDPDAEIVFDGVEMIVRAIKDIPHRDITKIYISYIEQIQLKEERQQYLNDHYFFTCQCYRCTSPYYENLLTKTVNGPLPDSVLDEFEENVELIHQMIRSKAKEGAILNACMKELKRQEGILADTHIFHIKVLVYAFDASIETYQWTDASILGKEIIEPFKLLYGKYHPVLGKHFFKVGKILDLLNFHESALKYLAQAEEIMKITYGEDHPLYKELIHLIDDIKLGEMMKEMKIPPHFKK